LVNKQLSTGDEKQALTVSEHKIDWDDQPLEVYPVNPDLDSQRWVMRGGDVLLNVKSKKAVTIHRGGKDGGTQVDISEDLGSQNQRWLFRSAIQ